MAPSRVVLIHLCDESAPTESTTRHFSRLLLALLLLLLPGRRSAVAAAIHGSSLAGQPTSHPYVACGVSPVAHARRACSTAMVQLTAITGALRVAPMASPLRSNADRCGCDLDSRAAPSPLEGKQTHSELTFTDRRSTLREASTGPWATPMRMWPQRRMWAERPLQPWG